MPRRIKKPQQSLEQLRVGEGYYSADQRRAILDSFEIRDDFEPKAFMASGGLGKTFTNDFFGCLEAEAHFYIIAVRGPPPSKVAEAITGPLRGDLKSVIERLAGVPDFTAVNEVTRGAKLLVEKGKGLKSAEQKKADVQVHSAVGSLNWLVECLDEAIANPQPSPGREEDDRRALIHGLARLYKEAAANPNLDELVTFLEAALPPLGALEDTERRREGIRKILKKMRVDVI